MSSDQLGGGQKAMGALYQGNMESSQLDQQAGMQRENARMAREKGASDADRQQIIAGHKIGAMHAGYGASGVSSQSGSVLDVLRMSAANAERDRLTILHGSNLRALNFENQAVMDEFGAKAALQAGYFNALTAVTGAGAGAYGKSPGSPNKTDANPEGDGEATADGEGGAEAGGEAGGEAAGGAEGAGAAAAL